MQPPVGRPKLVTRRRRWCRRGLRGGRTRDTPPRRCR